MWFKVYYKSGNLNDLFVEAEQVQELTGADGYSPELLINQRGIPYLKVLNINEGIFLYPLALDTFYVEESY